MSAADFQEEDTPNPGSWLYNCGTSCLAAVTHFLCPNDCKGLEQPMAPCKSWVHIRIESPKQPGRSSLDSSPQVLKLVALSFRLWPSEEGTGLHGLVSNTEGRNLLPGGLRAVTGKRVDGASPGCGSHGLSLGCSSTIGA